MLDDPGDNAFIQTEPAMMKVMTTKNTRFAIVGSVRAAARLHALAGAEEGSAFAGSDPAGAHHNDPTLRRRDGVWLRRFH